jgi:hypothetical protein
VENNLIFLIINLRLLCTLQLTLLSQHHMRHLYFLIIYHAQSGRCLRAELSDIEVLIHGIASTPCQTECFLQTSREQLGFLKSMGFHEDLWLGDADDRLPLMLLVGGHRAISE